MSRRGHSNSNQDIINGNEAGIEPQVNIQGLSLGCPHTNSDLEDNLEIMDAAGRVLHPNNTRVIFAHRMALISDAMYKSAKTSCNGNYIDSTNANCTKAVAAISQNFDYILFDIWINYKSVQDALHVRPSKGVFRCNITLTSEYSCNVKDAIPYHKNLTNSGLQILVFRELDTLQQSTNARNVMTFSIDGFTTILSSYFLSSIVLGGSFLICLS
uniref:Uncharacterized protein n=1 Tax=Quercus lobata TaxID=97700 RepID=A0A7N2MXQ8_QUELO